MALAEVYVDGLPEEFIAHSKISSSADAGADNGLLWYNSDDLYKLFKKSESSVCMDLLYMVQRNKRGQRKWMIGD